ncbi:unnamed protein product [Rhizophagus irregularis]|uniref:Uncharacterized protein n=1 Tax=Rhizophagus irregularis TaxID=588596 RepID=A0A2I1HS47_9GLOM|nr:hypothetical protein RhiirA4_486876 [Rhizophagus irregularis]CAB4415071.1 unnamed protein product [Rhizophagus irregularis]
MLVVLTCLHNKLNNNGFGISSNNNGFDTPSNNNGFNTSDNDDEFSTPYDDDGMYFVILKPSVILIATGIIIPDLHFGPFLRNWWHVRSLQENGMKVEQYYPFRIGMKTQVELKNRPFIIRIVQGNKHNNLLPGFFCESLSESNEEVENDPTSAISNLYKRIF